MTLFDGSILATAAVSAPTVMVKSARAVLDGLADLTDEERRRSARNIPGVAGQRSIGG